ncbi:MAG: hypothetical protein PGN24_02140 [Microbacterium arborescens]
MRRVTSWGAAALLASVVAVVIFWGATWYGAEVLVWDSARSTYFYAERPGGSAVMIAGVAVASIVALAALASAIQALVLATLPRRRARVLV